MEGYKKSSAKEFRAFMKGNIDSEPFVKTDEWARYKPIMKNFENMIRIKSGKKADNFTELHRVIMGSKIWLGRIHHSVNNLQTYIDEYTYRFN